MLRIGRDGDVEDMMSPAPARAVRPAVRDSERISAQIRRFALLWLVGAAAVMVFVVASSVLASHFRDTAGRRARTATATQLAVARVEANDPYGAGSTRRTNVLRPTR